MHELFDVNKVVIDEYNIFQIVDWLKKCRTAIKLNDKVVDKEIYTKYANGVHDFCEQWEEFAESHKDTYRSKKFKIALKLSVIPKAEYMIITKDYQEIIATDEFEEMQLQNLTSAKQIETSINREEKRTKEYSNDLIQFIDKGRRESLHNIINYLSLTLFTYKINILENESSINTKTLKQILIAIKKGKWKESEKQFEPEKTKTLSDYLVATIRKNNINKNLFYTFTKNKDKDKARVYNKSFFENVGFFLGLTLEEMEIVLCNEGYSIAYSKRKDDAIVAKCFNYYFPQHYASALLFKEGYDILDIGK